MEVQEGLISKRRGHCLARAYTFAQGFELSPLSLLMALAQCYACAKSRAHSYYSVQDNLSWPLSSSIYLSVLM